MHEINEGCGWLGEVECLILDAETMEVKRKLDYKNLITYDGENLMRDGLLGLEVDLKISHAAAGDDNTPPTKNDSTLGNETFRKSVTSTAQGGNGEAITIFQIGATEWLGLITELGFYVQGTGVADSGILISHLLFLNAVKTASEVLQIRRKDTLKGV